MNYQHITSLSNSKIKQIVKLTNSRTERYESGLAVVYGMHLIEEASKYKALHSIFINQDKIKDYKDILQLVDCEVYVVNKEILAKINLADSMVDIIGIINIRLGSIQEQTYTSDCVILENIQDPGNLGTILRVCAAIGVSNVCLAKSCVDPYSIKVLRASQGIQFSLNIIDLVDIAEFVDKYKFQVIATTPYTDRAIYHEDLINPCAWLFGNEGSGLSKEVLEKVKLKLSIPMSGKSESLNVAMAATVCLFEMQRQRLMKR